MLFQKPMQLLPITATNLCIRIHKYKFIKLSCNAIYRICFLFQCI